MATGRTVQAQDVSEAATPRPYPQAWSDVLVDGERILRIFVILAAGRLGYVKFLKGRVFKPSLELEVSGRTDATQAGQAAVVVIRLKNNGVTKVSLSPEGTAARISKPRNVHRTPIEWTPDAIVVFELFKDHHWIEPGEMIKESHVIVLKEAQPVLRFEARVTSPNIEWNASEICTTPVEQEGA